MGAYSPAPILSDEVYDFTIEKVIKPLIDKLSRKRNKIQRDHLCRIDDRK